MAAVNGELVEQIRQAVTAAQQAGGPTPGRPTLVRLTGATDHAVRRALADLAAKRVKGGEPEGSLPHTNADDSNVELISVWEPGEKSTPGRHQALAVETALPPPGGRLVAWTGFVFGSVMSIAANVLHAWLPVGHEPVGWSPGIAPQIGAAVWPIGLMLAVEALSRIHWPRGLGWGLARFGGAGAVATGSAVISYGHLRDVLRAWSYGPMAAAVGPLVLDGLMVVCGFALLAMSRTSAGDAGEHRT
jgi:hypothetical protein